MTWFLFSAVLLVAYTNGANANFKGVASLYGSGTTSYRQAVSWAAVTTAMGCLLAMWTSSAMLTAFSGKGLVSDSLAQQPSFRLAVATAAGLTGLLATRLGFPTSTTHMLMGGLLGAGWVAEADGVNTTTLGTSFALPLLVSPILAIAVSIGLSSLFKALRWLPTARTRQLDALHGLSAGAVCFARGMNDTPKMAALVLGLGGVSGMTGSVLVALAMAAGGLISAQRVADTLAHDITPMNPAEGFIANVSTALLTTTASHHGLPVSTTHVSVGALLGIGLHSRQVKWRTTLPVLAAWVITLPCAALLGALSWICWQHVFS